ncbi:MAG: NAD(P)-dependent oxidoreductase [Deltaproteobacteria bacterium]|nr:NAD(P)-dependent oxidoreductase [Deltaproteobacteria bacterium]
MKKLLITGATGFIGRHALATAIFKGYDVYAVTSREPLPATNNVKWIQLDLFNYDQVKQKISEIKPSHLLHFGWYAEPGKYWAAVENVKWVQASLELLMAFQRSGGKRAVFAGSCAEYDWDYGFCRESLTPCKPATLYGVCKNSLQQIFNKFCAQTELSGAWGRIFYLYGPYEHPSRLVPSVICSLMQGKEALCSHGNQIRDFMYVQDVAEAFVDLLESNIQGPINVATGNPIRIRDLVLMIANKLKAIDRVRFGAITAAGDEPPLLVADVRRLGQGIARASSFTLDQGIDLTIDWWSKNSLLEIP